MRLTDSRIYVVEPTDGRGAERLVRAANKSRAVRQAVTARIATQGDLERLLALGVEVEPKSTGRVIRARRLTDEEIAAREQQKLEAAGQRRIAEV